MGRWVALLRGINVGGHNVVKMTELRDTLEDAGLEQVQTYIQSGNIVFASSADRDGVAKIIMACLADRFGIDAPLTVLDREEVEACLKAMPFEGDPSRILIHFCMEPLKDCNDSFLREYLRDDEALLVTREAIFLHAPAGISQSKLAGRIEKLVPVPLTARNLRTVQKLYEMATGS